MTNITPLDFDPNRRDQDRRLHLRGVPDDRSQRYQGIGSEFAAARTQAGMDVAQVAVALRIRKEHLSAIEEGRFSDLPAPAYALGFVRSYADYLGLDPAAAVEAFKQETSTSRRRTPLVFPTAEPVERVPRGWLLGMSALLAAVVFGAWYYSERTGIALLDRVPTPPTDGAAQVAAAPAANNAGLNVVDVRTANAGTPPRDVPAAAPPAPATATLDPAIGRVLGVLPGTAANQTPPPAATAAAPAAAQQEAPAPAVPAVVPTPPPVVAAAPQPAPTPEPVVAAVEPPAAAPVVATPEPEIAVAEPAPSPMVAPAGEPVAVVEELPALTPAPTAAPELIVTPPAILAPPVAIAAAEVPPALPIVPPAAPVDMTVAARDGQVFGATSGRVVILAHQDSWVQITGAAGELLLTRILRAGDKYIAPAREDLVLMTGNAGALEVSVDGRVIAPLGPAGTVRRNVSLSADRLLNGTAIQP